MLGNKKFLLRAALLVLPVAAYGCGAGAPKVVEAAELTKAPILPQTGSASVATLQFVTAAAPSTGVVGETVNVPLQATGGEGPYQWSVVSGSLPDGLTLSNGVISGRFAAAGNWHAVVQVTDSEQHSQKAKHQVSFQVSAAATSLAIATTSLASARTGAAYRATLSATGGAPSYSWSVGSGTLPDGLALSSSGVISGTPTTSGTKRLSIAVHDSGNPNQSQQRSLSLQVDAAPLTITSTSVGAAQQDSSYSTTLHATGGNGKLTWTVSAGTLPTGLKLTNAGVLSGTPTKAQTSIFTVAVHDAGSQAQSTTAVLTLAVNAAPNGLSINTGNLATATSGVVYGGQLSATGGTPSYTWSITKGSLPSGLTLQATTGAITGTPSSTGSSTFTYTVVDNSSPKQQTASASATISVSAATASGPGTTWFIRTDGGTRYSASGNLQGQCDGKSNSAYPGSGVNQHCAFNDYRLLWDDHEYNHDQWVIAGGDTVILGQNASGWRVGFDQSGPNDPWCLGGSGPFACTNPTIPSGSPTQHTRILGANYAACSTAAGQPDVTKMSQIFGGHGVNTALNLTGAQYVDVQCVEVTRHSQCMVHGLPIYGKACSSSFPVDDYDSEGVRTDNATHDLLLQDMYIHGHVDSGIIGSVGGLITANRIKIAFNGMSGWNLDDGTTSRPPAGSTLKLSYLTVIASGCIEEYPNVHPFPALVCYDQNSAGYGDGLGTPAGFGVNILMDHSVFAYNTQDGLDAGHVDSGTNKLSITDSYGYGNEGQAFKWGPNFQTATFTNNFVLSDCARMSAPLQGAPSNYNQYLSQWCRAQDTLSFNFRQGGTLLMANNSIVGYAPTVLDVGCADSSCSTSAWTFMNNAVRAYYDPITANGGGQTSGPGLFYFQEGIGIVNRNNNMFFGVRGACPANTVAGGSSGLLQGESCQDPGFTGEPQVFGTESDFDKVTFVPVVNSPLLGAGVPISSVPDDYFGTKRGNPPSIGAVE